MANSKISALTSATTPLAGTEVLPIVQSSATVKVATNDLTVKNVRSNATTGILQVAGPSAGSTRTMTTPDANFTVARTDASNSFTGDQTLSTGNLIQGTAAKGFNFTANTGAAGMTSQLLNWYEEGTVTATLTSSTGTITLNNSYKTLYYTRIGRLVVVHGLLIVDTVAAPTGTLSLNGLPFTSNSAGGSRNSITVTANNLAATATTSIVGNMDNSATSCFIYKYAAGALSALAGDVVGGSSFNVTITYIT